MAENCDSRGVPRGRCTVGDCDCRKYDGAGSGGKKCVCHHPPGKHVNVNLPVCNQCSKNSSAGFDFCSPLCRNVAIKNGDYDIADMIELEKSLHPVSINECKASGCTNPVFWDYKMEFLYCSPVCRDNDILKESQRKLHEDVEVMEKVIEELSKSTRQGSYRKMESSVDRDPGTSQSNNNTLTDYGLRQERQEGSSDSQKTGKSTKLTGKRQENDQASSSRVQTFEQRNRQYQHQGETSSEVSYREVSFLKDANGDHGIIVCNEFWRLGSEMGILITGVKVDERRKSFQAMKQNQLQFFDIIVKINDVKVSDHCQDGTPQAVLNKLLLPQRHVKLHVYRPVYALNTTQDTIKLMTKRHDGRPSHIIAVVCPDYFAIKVVMGMTISNKKVIKVLREEQFQSSAELCGLRDGDEYLVSVPASKHRQILLGSSLSKSSSSGTIMEQWRDTLYSRSSDLIVSVFRQ